MVCRSCPANPLHPGILLELLPNVRSSCFLMRSSYHRPICMSTDNMCIFYTFVPFYKFKMQYLYSFTKPFSIVSYAEVPILYYLCYFSHYVVYQMCFRNTYCVTDDIRYRGHKIFRPQELAHGWVKDLVTRPDRSIKVGCNPTICDYRAGLWECAARNNPAGIKTRNPGTLKCRSFLRSGIFSYQFLLYFRL